MHFLDQADSAKVANMHGTTADKKSLKWMSWYIQRWMK